MVTGVQTCALPISATLEQMSTNVVAKPMDKPFTADVVVARVGHMPRSRTNVGFSFNSPLSNIFRFFIFIYIVFFYFIIITCRFFALQDKFLAPTSPAFNTNKPSLIYDACVWAMRLLLYRRQGHFQHYFFYKPRTPCLLP